MVTAYLVNAKNKFDAESQLLDDFYRNLNRNGFAAEEVGDPWGVLTLHTTVVHREWTTVGELTGIPFLMRVQSVFLRSSECTPGVWPVLERLEGLRILIIRGEISASDLDSFRDARPDVEVLTLPQ
jgi:hypothetical protein